MTELPMHADRMLCGKKEFTFCYTSGDVHDTHDGEIAVHNEQHVVVSNRHCGVNLVASRRVVVPDYFFVGVNLANAELMCEQDVAIRQHDGVTDFAFPRGIVVRPHNLTMAHDEDAAVARFAGVHEVMLGKSFAGKVRGNGRRRVWRGLSKTAKNQCKRRNNESRSGHFHFPTSRTSERIICRAKVPAWMAVISLNPSRESGRP